MKFHCLLGHGLLPANVDCWGLQFLWAYQNAKPTSVMFQGNIQLDLSRVAMTLLLSTLFLKLALQILCESSWFMSVWMVQGCEGVGDMPGVQGVQGGSVCSM